MLLDYDKTILISLNNSETFVVKLFIGLGAIKQLRLPTKNTTINELRKDVSTKYINFKT